MKPTIWHNCYDSSWTGVITPESFAHPAKYARGLIERIFDHCLAKGYFKKGDRVGDCFGGIGTGGIAAAYRGLPEGDERRIDHEEVLIARRP